MSMKVLQYPHESLRKPSLHVEHFDEQLTTLAFQLGETIERSSVKALGLSAPQVGIPLRVFVVHPDAYQGKGLAPHIFVNPRIKSRWVRTSSKDEGCLSLPQGVTVQVMRSDEIVIHAQDVSGSTFHFIAGGLAARVIQHEIDHLDGIMVLDKCSRQQRRAALRKIEKSLQEPSYV